MKKLVDARTLGIDLTSKNEAQLFEWFLACVLFGEPITQAASRRAYEAITQAGGITSINKLAKTGWNALATILDEAQDARYQLGAATKLLGLGKRLKENYGTVSRLLKQSKDIRELDERLAALGGIGPATVANFTQGVAPFWYAETAPHDFESAVFAAEILDQHNYEVFMIGGAVRDLLLGREPKDFDLVTNATPEQIMSIPEFSQSNYKDTAQAYGVTRVKFTHQDKNNELEIATFRKDIEAHRGRKATKVEFAELEDDVMRRDITVNALALDPHTNQVIDYVGGIDDLENRLIRFIGKPQERIHEDPLRIMRAIRFKNHLGFSYHPQTINAIKTSVDLGYVETIAVDRLRDELTKLLVHPSRRSSIADLDEFGILERVLPEVTAGKRVEQPPQFHAEGNVWQHELLILDYLPDSPSKRLAWAALLHDIGKGPTSIKPHTPKEKIRFDSHYSIGAEMARAILGRLKFSNHDTKDITWMIHNHMAIDDLPAMRPSRQQRMLGNPAFEDLLELHRADAAASWRPNKPHDVKPKFRSIEHLWHQYQSKSPELRQPLLKRDLGIDGRWLIARFGTEFDLKNGAVIGWVLRELDEWYRDEGISDKKAYAKKARQLLEQCQEKGITVNRAN